MCLEFMIVQLVVQLLLCHELCVCAVFADDTVRNHEYGVEMPDGGDFLADHDGGLPAACHCEALYDVVGGVCIDI